MERVAFVMKAKAGYEEEYVRRHKEVWPKVLSDMKKAGVHKMSIFMQGRELFESARWEEYMTPIMENAAGEAYDPNNAYPDGLPEVFYWEAS